jgi:membrane protein
MKRHKALQEYLSQWWSDRSPITRMLVQYLRQALTNFGRYGPRRAAALAYYTIFSVFPLTLLLTIGISRLLGAAVAQNQVANALSFFLPETSTVELLLRNIELALEQNVSFGVIALLGLAWSGLGLFSSITSSLDLIFEVPRRRSIWRQRLVALLMILILVVLVTASFVTSGVITLISVLFFVQPGIWLSIATVFLPLSLNMLIFLLLFRYVPARTVYWDAIWPAALVGGVGFELAKRAFAWYLVNLANYQIVYGSIATVIILLFWAYMLASIFLFSAELCAQLNNWLEESKPRHLFLLESGDEA